MTRPPTPSTGLMQQFLDELLQGLSPDGTSDPFAPDGGHRRPGSMTVSIDLSTTRLAQVRHELGRVIVGQDRVVDRLLVAVLADGHVLLEGAPGLGKTLLLATLARILGGSFNRIQFTPDLIPSDIVGTRIFRPSSEVFDVEPGPIIANVVLVDEINRAPARVQSALLEAMAERQVTVGGRTFAMPQPFLVVATQNPVESEGVYPLAEAQRDRFLMRIPVDYPTPTEERAIVARMADEPPQAARLLDPADVVDLQLAARRVAIDDAAIDYAIRLVLATRDPAAHGLPKLVGLLEYGASPRASLGLVRSARAMALLRGRQRAVPQDVYDVAYDILNARLALSYRALAEGFTIDDVLVELLTTVPAPGSTAWPPPVPAAYADPSPAPPSRRSPRTAPVDGPSATPWGAPARRRRSSCRAIHRPRGDLRTACRSRPAGTAPPHRARGGPQGGRPPRRPSRLARARPRCRARGGTTLRAGRRRPPDGLVDPCPDRRTARPRRDPGARPRRRRPGRPVRQPRLRDGRLAEGRSGRQRRIGRVGARRPRRRPDRGGRRDRRRATDRADPRRSPASDGPRGQRGTVTPRGTGRSRSRHRRSPTRPATGWTRGRGLGLHRAPETWSPALARLGRRSEIIAVEVLDPRELRLPDVGLLVVEDPETGRQRTIDTSDERFRVRLAEVADRRRAARSSAIRRAGATHLRLRTDTEWTGPLAACLDRRRRARALGRHVASHPTTGAAR